jgi:hypothetical protein
LNHINPVHPVEGVKGIYVAHPTGECEESRSCFDWAQHERISSRPTDIFRITGISGVSSACSFVLRRVVDKTAFPVGVALRARNWLLRIAA